MSIGMPQTTTNWLFVPLLAQSYKVGIPLLGPFERNPFAKTLMQTHAAINVNFNGQIMQGDFMLQIMRPLSGSGNLMQKQIAGTQWHIMKCDKSLTAKMCLHGMVPKEIILIHCRIIIAGPVSDNITWIVCQRQVSWAETSNYTTHKVRDIITYPYPWYLHTNPNTNRLTFS